ncbi:MAG: hypothetical protein ABI789_00215 [Usitatibacter sp.]
MRRGLAAIGCALAMAFANAATPEQEAEAAGRVGDAAALARIIAQGKPDIVDWFGRGMQFSQMDLPADVEALVIASFDDARVGARLRAMPSRYRTRKLFDLHYARVEKAFLRSEPSIAEILNTDQDGIEEDLLRLGAKLPPGERGISDYVYHVARRHHPAAVPILLAALDESFSDPRRRGFNDELESLLAYPSIDIWKKTALELDRLRAQDRLAPEQHKSVRARVDALIADPAKLEQAKNLDGWERYMRRVRAIPVNLGRLEALKSSDPAAYVREQERFLASKEAIGREIESAFIRRNLGHEAFQLGLFARFRARDPAGAIRSFMKAAELGNDFAQVAIADTYQFDLDDRRAAVSAYRKALGQAKMPRRANPDPVYDAPGSRVNAWWRAWFEQEISFLETGKSFRGTIGEAQIGGFFEVMLNKAPAVTAVFAPEFRQPNSRGVRTHLGQRLGGTWSAARDQLMNIGRPTLKMRLDALPSSRIALMMAIRHASALPDPDAIVAYFARNDPSGYWSTYVFGTVAYLDGLGPKREEEAARNESAELLPGMAADDEPRPLSLAAQTFMKSRNLRSK